MPNASVPSTIINAIEAPDGVGQVEVRSTLSFLDGKHLKFGTTTGGKIGTTTSEKIGFWGATPVVQQSISATPPSAVDTSPATDSSPYGYTTQAQANAIFEQLNLQIASHNELLAKLATTGILA